MKDRPTDYATVVREHAARTTGIILADSGDCLDIRGHEVRHVRRMLRPVASGDLEKLELPDSWMLAAILCRGDSTSLVAGWAARLSAPLRDRIRFYQHPDCDLVAALAPWYAAGLDDARVVEVRDFTSFHKEFGVHLNDRIYADAVAGVS
jgi:hypothetical protein